MFNIFIPLLLELKYKKCAIFSWAAKYIKIYKNIYKLKTKKQKSNSLNKKLKNCHSNQLCMLLKVDKHLVVNS